MSELAPAERQASIEVALRARIRDLEACLGLNDKSLSSIFRLSKGLSDLLGLLLNTPNVTSDMIQHRLRLATDAKVAVHRLRKELEKWAERNKEERIEIHGKRSLGYWLDAPTKARIRTLLATPSAEEEAVEAVAGEPL